MTGRKKILLIDDEEDFCFFMKQNLERTSKFQVTTANEGAKGIGLAKKEKPDLILLDIVMPELSGSKVAELLLGDSRTRKIPIIFLTAVVTKEEMGPGFVREIGGQSFIAKTVGSEKIVTFIKEILKDNS